MTTEPEPTTAPGARQPGGRHPAPGARTPSPPGRRPPRLLVEAEADLQPHLVVRHRTVLEMAADLGDLEPVQSPHGRRRARHRGRDGLVDRARRGPDDL